MTRAELYALVWETPSVHVASRFGMSNAALRKLCETYDVPLPPAGYWTKVAYGKQPARTPLPKDAPTLLKKIGGALRRIGQASLDMTDAQIAGYDLDLVAGREQAGRGRTIDRLKEIFAAASRDETGFVTASLANGIECRVGVASQARAVALADGLIETALIFDFVLSDKGGLTFDGEAVALRIYETRTTPRATPSGRFCLELYDPRPFQWTRRNLIGHWHDRIGRPVEQMVRSAITAAINVAPLVKRVRAAAETADLEVAKTGRAQARQELDRYEVQFLRDMARSFAELAELKALAAELRQRGTRDARVKRMLDRLSHLIVALEASSHDDALAGELRDLKLFEDRD